MNTKWESIKEEAYRQLLAGQIRVIYHEHYEPGEYQPHLECSDFREYPEAIDYPHLPCSAVSEIIIERLGSMHDVIGGLGRLQDGEDVTERIVAELEEPPTPRQKEIDYRAIWRRQGIDDDA